MSNIQDNVFRIDTEIIKNSRKYPDKIAIQYKNKTISYKQLIDRALSIAIMLIDKEVKVNTTIAVCMDVLPVSLDIYIGAFMAGCTILPLCTSDPSERQLYKLGITNAPLLFLEEKYSELFSDYNGEKLYVDENTLFSRENSGENDSSFKLIRSNNAYILFTSGTTGTPKGILNTMDNLTDHIFSYSEMCGMTSNDISMGFSPLYFDCVFEEVFSPLLTCGTVVIPDNSNKIDPEYMISQLNENHITILSAPPPILNILNKQVSNGRKLEYLRIILTGGDVLRYNDINFLINNFIVKNGYGLSEATISTLWHDVTDKDIHNIPIGKPIRNKLAYILDDEQKPVKTGEMGEIYLGGSGVSLGYLLDEKLTKEKFVRNPFVTDENQMMVKSGDLGRFLEDGSIEFLGRKDRQVNISGIRMELLEIENTLMKYESIQDCSVVVSTDEDVNYLSAYLVIKENDTLDLDKLIELIKKSLPLFMLPRNFYKVNNIPRTEVGKVDLQALKQLDSKLYLHNTNDMNTLSNTERIILGIWSEVLKIDERFIPLDANFFEIGGSSILLMSVLTRLRIQFEKSIILSDLVTNATIFEQSQFIESTIEGLRELVIPRSAHKEYYKITSSQKRIWILSNLECNSAIYNTVSVSSFNGDLNIELFHNTLNKIIHDYPILTVSFIKHDEAIYQKPRTNCDFPFTYIDIANYDKESRDTKINEYVEQEKNYNFDLENEILIHSCLFKIKERQFIFVLNMHHIITDNQSWIIMLSKLRSMYNCETNETNETNEMTETTGVSYFDYAEFEEKFIMSEEVQQQLEYWKSKLVNSQSMVLDLMPNRRRPDVLGVAGDSKKFALNKHITNQIKGFVQKQNVSFYSFLLATFKILVYKYTGQKDTIIGTPVINRSLIETNSMVGLFLNTICIRNEMHQESSPVTFMHQIHSAVQEAICNQDYPFEKIIEHLNLERKLNQAPVFQVLFDYHGDDTDIFNLDGIEIENISMESNWAKNELTITGFEDSGKLVLDFEYNKALYTTKFIDNLITHYVKLIETILSYPEEKISKINILTVNDYVKINEYNRKNTINPESLVFHEIFEQQVLKCPQKIAYRYENEAITFDDLNRKANKIARVLRRLGIGPNIIVAIYFDKSIDLQATILALIKAGAAYLPLDPNHPEGHIKNIIDISNPNVILTCGKYVKNLCLDYEILDIDKYKTEIDNECEDNLDNQSDMDSLFNIIFTSASTGTPKGVMTPMGAIMNRLWWAWSEFPFEEGDVMSHHKSYTLIGSFWEMFGGLLQGIETVIIPRESILSGVLRNEIITNNITHLFASPPILKPLMKDVQVNGIANIKLKLVACSAEPISGEFVEQWKKIFKNTKFINLYGSTEDCSDVTFYDTDKMEEISDIIPAGKPISNTKIYILDADNNIVPANIAGKICVAGAAVSKGYINNKVLTDRMFKTLTLSNGEIERIYFTGDIGYIDENFNLIVLGRYDHQVKIRGYLMELSDIELSFKEIPSVKNVGVITSGKDNDDKQIVAYIALLEKNQTTKKSLLDAVRKKLPEYMVPNRIIILDELPMTPNGKIDRLRLSNLDDFIDENEAYIEPRTPMERVIKEIWENILETSRISVYDNFFQIGGDSLKAIQMIGHIRHIFLINYPIMELFTKPTIAAMSLYISNLEVEEDLSFEIQNNPLREKYPLAYIQEGFWFYNKLEPKNIFYNIAANRIKGKFNFELFKKAFHEIILRHDALRMVFGEEKGVPYIRILENIEVNIPVVDLRHLSELDKKK